MINENRIQFFEALLKSLKWKWTDEEQLALWDKFPFDIQNGNFGKLLVSIVENLDSKPKKKALRQYVWDFSKGVLDGKKKTVIEHAGCNNCVAGYIRLPDLRQFKEYDFPLNMSNLTHFSWWTTDFLCPCTGDTRFREKVEDIKSLVFQDPELYEFCFISMFGFFSESVNPKRFKDIKEFNPYKIWNIDYEPCHLVEPIHFRYVFEGGSKPKKKELKRIPKAEYNKEIYS